MSQVYLSSLTPFQRNLLFFAQPHPPYGITILSALRSTLSLGVNFPVSLIISIWVRLLYTPLLFSFKPSSINSISPDTNRTQLESVTINPSRTTGYTVFDLISLYNDERKINPAHGKSQSWLNWAFDIGHLITFWTIAAGEDNLVSVEDMRRFQKGDWAEQVVKRRRSRLTGKGEVLPFWRGGPILVRPHSWAVRTFFGVKVYEAKSSD